MNDKATPCANSGVDRSKSTKKHIRASGLLLAGRILSLSLNLIVQVLTVRYLTKNDYGSFAYALSIVAFATQISGLGFYNALPRFVPIYHERRPWRSLERKAIFVPSGEKTPLRPGVR